MVHVKGVCSSHLFHAYWNSNMKFDSFARIRCNVNSLTMRPLIVCARADEIHVAESINCIFHLLINETKIIWLTLHLRGYKCHFHIWLFDRKFSVGKIGKKIKGFSVARLWVDWYMQFWFSHFTNTISMKMRNWIYSNICCQRECMNLKKAFFFLKASYVIPYLTMSGEKHGQTKKEKLYCGYRINNFID